MSEAVFQQAVIAEDQFSSSVPYLRDGKTTYNSKLLSAADDRGKESASREGSPHHLAWSCPVLLFQVLSLNISSCCYVLAVRRTGSGESRKMVFQGKNCRGS